MLYLCTKIKSRMNNLAIKAIWSCSGWKLRLMSTSQRDLAIADQYSTNSRHYSDGGGGGTGGGGGVGVVLTEVNHYIAHDVIHGDAPRRHSSSTGTCAGGAQKTPENACPVRSEMTEALFLYSCTQDPDLTEQTFSSTRGRVNKSGSFLFQSLPVWPNGIILKSFKLLSSGCSNLRWFPESRWVPTSVVAVTFNIWMFRRIYNQFFLILIIPFWEISEGKLE